jgi:hypothetical protein
MPRSDSTIITAHITSNSIGFSFPFIASRGRPVGVENYRVNLS